MSQISVIFAAACGKTYGDHFGFACPEGHSGFVSEDQALITSLQSQLAKVTQQRDDAQHAFHAAISAMEAHCRMMDDIGSGEGTLFNLRDLRDKQTFALEYLKRRKHEAFNSGAPRITPS